MTKLYRKHKGKSAVPPGPLPSKSPSICRQQLPRSRSVPMAPLLTWKTISRFVKLGIASNDCGIQCIDDACAHLLLSRDMGQPPLTFLFTEQAHIQQGPSIYAASSSVCCSTQAVLRTGQTRTRQNRCCPLGAEQCMTEKNRLLPECPLLSDPALTYYPFHTMVPIHENVSLPIAAHSNQFTECQHPSQTN